MNWLKNKSQKNLDYCLNIFEMVIMNRRVMNPSIFKLEKLVNIILH